MTPLLLVPGLGSDEAVWRPVIERLADVVACVVAETRLDDSIAAIAERVLTSGPPRFALAGISMGGYVALEMVRQVPERVGELDVLTPPALAEELRDGIPGASLHIIAGRGHLPPIEKPDETAVLLRAWLAA